MDYNIKNYKNIKDIPLPTMRFKGMGKKKKGIFSFLFGNKQKQDFNTKGFYQNGKLQNNVPASKSFSLNDFQEKHTYGNVNNKKQTSNMTRTKKRKKRKLHIFRKIFVFFLSLGILGLFLGLGMIKGILDSTPSLSQFSFGPTAFATRIYDRDGNLMDTLVREGSNREYVKYEDIPKILINAFVAIEDERFWEHNGIDMKSIIRAITGVIQSDNTRGGGSTITQQLVKNAVFDSALNEKGFEKYVRKLQEQYIAFQYETQDDMSKLEVKQEIITDYLNTINLGANTLGVKVASKRYFDKDLQDLTISECAVIASITKNPTKNNPITHPENNQKRQRQVLLNMKNQGYITDEEYKEALDDDVYSRIKNVDTKVEAETKVYTYFTEAVIDQLKDDFTKRLGYTSALTNNLLYSGGLRVETTMDPTIQSIVDAEVKNESNYKTRKYSIDYRLSIRHSDDTETHYSQVDVERHQTEVIKNRNYNGLFLNTAAADQCIEAFKKYVMTDTDTISGETLNYLLEPQCSFVLINHHNGEVLALNGGRGEKTVSRSLNRATKTVRQPGSTFKVLSSFAPALEVYGKTLASVYYDSEYTYKKKTFKNWYNTGYLGFQNIRSGIIYSLNIIAVRCLMETVTPEVGVQYARKFGITSIDETHDANPATALGGLTYGVTNLQLTSAFATIANSGKYIQPKLYTKVYDRSGNILIDNTKIVENRVISDENAYLLTSAMADSMTYHKAFSSPTMNITSTSTRAYFKGMALAGKSGTTTNNNDVWFVGYSPYYTAGVWGGCDENQSLYDSKTKVSNGGTSYHKDIWKKIMQTIHTSLTKAEFEKPAGIIERTVCKKSGMLANDGCKIDPRGDATYTEYFVDGTQPKTRCTLHTNMGFINMPSKYIDLKSDDSFFIQTTAVIPIIGGSSQTVIPSLTETTNNNKESTKKENEESEENETTKRNTSRN